MCVTSIFVGGWFFLGGGGQFFCIFLCVVELCYYFFNIHSFIHIIFFVYLGEV